MKNRIYLLHRTDAVGYDEAAGFVVIAKDENTARELVASATYPGSGPGDEGAAYWWTPRPVVIEIGVAHEDALRPGVVLRDFHHG